MVGMVRQAGCGEGSEGVRSHTRNPSDSPSKGPCPCAGPASSYVCLRGKVGPSRGTHQDGVCRHTCRRNPRKGGGGGAPQIAWSLHSRPAAASQGAGSQHSLEKMSRLDQTTQGLRLQLPGKERTR